MVNQHTRQQAIVLVVALVGMGLRGRAEEASPSLPAAQDTARWQPSAAREVDQPFYLGLQATAAGKPEARRAGVGAAAGAAVLRVDSSSPAERAGLRRGDLIVRYGEYDIENVEELVAAVSLSPRQVPQRLDYVRGTRRRTTEFLPGVRSGAPSPSWYVHPDGGFRLQLPTGWNRQEPTTGGANVTILWDVLLSVEQLYGIDVVRRTKPAPSVAAALESFVSERRKYVPGATVAETQLGSVPAIWVASYQGTQSRVAMYDLAFCHAGNLYSLQITAPASSLLDELPLPVRHLLGTLQLAKVGPSPAGPAAEDMAGPPPAAPPQPPAFQPPAFQPPAGWTATTCGELRLYLPPDWQPVEGVREGEGMWQWGEGEIPRASLALVRNQPWEQFAAARGSAGAPNRGHRQPVGRHLRGEPGWEQSAGSAARRGPASRRSARR